MISRLSFQRRLITRAIVVIAIIEPLATLPQVLAVYTTHNATSIAVSTWTMYVLFALAWLWYGIVEKEKAIIISSVFFALADGAMVIGGLLYGGRW